MRHRISRRIFLPEETKGKVEELIRLKPPEFSNFNKDKLFYFLSLINELPARNKRSASFGNGYTLINATVLRKTIGNYKDYIDYLREQMVVVCDNHFIPKEKSYGYKFMPAYDGKVKAHYINNPTLIGKLNKEKLENSIRLKKYKYLTKWFDDIEVDFSGALKYVKGLYVKRILNPEAREWNYRTGKYKNPIEQYNNALINLHHIKDGVINCFVDKIAGRLHTNLTNMPSDLRNFITWKGKKLGAVDITNSQPFLSSVLFQKSFYGNYAVGNDEKLSLFSFSEGFSFSPTIELHNNITYDSNIATTQLESSSLKLQESPQLAEQPDVKLFLELVENGRFYEHLEEAFKAEWGSELGTRKAVKGAVFLVLFTDNRFLGQDEAKGKRLFKKLFPNVYKLFAAYKKHDPRGLPILLQRIEVKLILDIIAKRIAKEMPRIPTFTIHDSITTTVEHIDYLQRVMKEELKKYIGVEPKFKVEYWDQGQLDWESILDENILAARQANVA